MPASTLRKLQSAALALALTAPAAALAISAAPSPVLRAAAAQWLPMSAVSFAIVDAESGRVVLSHGADTLRSPASTIKLLTTIASLDLLGPAYTWHTRALKLGEIDDGVLNGDLVLKGGGDPYMTLERWWSFVRRLRVKGLRSIRGDIVVDESAYALPAEDPAAFDGRPNRVYNVQPDALMVNFRSIDFRIAPNPATHKIEIAATPAPQNLVIENHIDFAAGRCSAHAARVDFEVASEQWDRVVFTGALSPECAERSITRVLLKPPDYAFGTFVELWKE
jgi:D-alanyl-D-alanine carboxypeptidase/D-alanyl-D-alanine-endopeptidase (penicillin-binding protein 4)